MDSSPFNRPQEYHSQNQLGSPVVGSSGDFHRVEYSQNSFASQHSRNGASTDEFGYTDWRGGTNSAYSTTLPGGGPSSRFAQQYDQSGSHPTSPVLSAPSGGGHFATFPVRKGSSGPEQSMGYQSTRAPQPLQPFNPPDDANYGREHGHDRDRDMSLSFSAEVASALSTDPRFVDPAGGANLRRGETSASLDGPLPKYEAHYDSPAIATGLPKGAAPPNSSNPWSTPSAGSSSGGRDLEPLAGHGKKDLRLSQTSDVSSELPYISEESDDQQEKHVRFGGRSTIDDGYGDDRDGIGSGHGNGSSAHDYKDRLSAPGMDDANRFSRDSEYTDDDEGTGEILPVHLRLQQIRNNRF